MKLFRALGLAAFAILACSGPMMAQAQTVAPTGTRFVGVASATNPGQTFATTSYADLTGATLSVTPRAFPNQTEAPGTPARATYIVVDWSADVTKATATTGICALYANGAVIAASERYISSAASRGTIGGTYTVANSLNAAQTVKLQCKSGDTNVFTVNNAIMSLSLVR